MKLANDRPTETDLDNYEVGFEDGYQDYLDGEPCYYETDGNKLYLVLESSGRIPVQHADAWYAIGVIRGWEQAREDDR